MFTQEDLEYLQEQTEELKEIEFDYSDYETLEMI